MSSAIDRVGLHGISTQGDAMSDANRDGTIRMPCNDDRDAGWYPGKLYQIFPQSSGSKPNSSMPVYAPPTYNAGISYTTYPLRSTSSGGGTLGEVVAGILGGLAILAVVGVAIFLAVGALPGNQGGYAGASNYNYQATVTAVTKVGCNFRVRPSRRGRRIGSVSKGTSIQILKSGTWDRVRLPDGEEGYIFDRLIAR